MIRNYEIGGNEIRVDASESIAAIPENKTLLVEQLTSDDPVHPEIVTGLTSIDQVFQHYKPFVEVGLENAEGQPVQETFHFKNVGDFSVKKLTEQSPFLNRVHTEKEFYDGLIKQLKSNKVLQRVLENQESKEAFIEVLTSVLAELESEENKK